MLINYGFSNPRYQLLLLVMDGRFGFGQFRSKVKIRFGFGEKSAETTVATYQIQT